MRSGRAKWGNVRRRLSCGSPRRAAAKTCHTCSGLQALDGRRRAMVVRPGAPAAAALAARARRDLREAHRLKSKVSHRVSVSRCPPAEAATLAVRPVFQIKTPTPPSMERQRS